MRMVDLDQNTPAWEEWRRGGLGASDAAAILGVSPFKTPLRLWQEMTGAVAREEASFAMRRGQRLEPMIRRWYESRVGHPMPPLCCEHRDHPWLKASLDGYDICDGHILEIKAPNQVAHAQALAGTVPPYYYPQLQHQLAVTGSPRLVYVSYTEHRAFTDEQRFALVEVLPDPETIRYLMFREWCFWGMVQLKQWWEWEFCPTLIPKAMKTKEAVLS